MRSLYGHGPRRRSLVLRTIPAASRSRSRDVRMLSDAGERLGEIRVAALAEHQFAHDEELPAVTDLIEGMGDGAVLAVALHTRIVCDR